MSVHGEFSRTLEGVIDVLRSSHEPPEADAWRKALEEARLDTQPDLSSAARAAWMAGFSSPATPSVSFALSSSASALSSPATAWSSCVCARSRSAWERAPGLASLIASTRL